ncbi:MAG: hypothetical protein KGJ13_03985 [Patescibacteria group bacterium]|nr:hypothetical protein [Patescibacteria group bacterium]
MENGTRFAGFTYRRKCGEWQLVGSGLNGLGPFLESMVDLRLKLCRMLYVNLPRIRSERRPLVHRDMLVAILKKFRLADGDIREIRRGNAGCDGEEYKLEIAILASNKDQAAGDG